MWEIEECKKKQKKRDQDLISSEGAHDRIHANCQAIPYTSSNENTRNTQSQNEGNQHTMIKI